MFANKALVPLLFFLCGAICLSNADPRMTCLCNQDSWTSRCEGPESKMPGVRQCKGYHCIIAQSNYDNKTSTTYKCGPARLTKDECYTYVTNFGSLEHACYCSGEKCNSDRLIQDYAHNRSSNIVVKKVMPRNVDDDREMHRNTKKQPQQPKDEELTAWAYNNQMYRLMALERSMHQERNLLNWIIALTVISLCVLLVLAALTGCFICKLRHLIPSIHSTTLVEKISISGSQKKDEPEPLFTRTATSPPPPYQKPLELTKSAV